MSDPKRDDHDEPSDSDQSGQITSGSEGAGPQGTPAGTGAPLTVPVTDRGLDPSAGASVLSAGDLIGDDAMPTPDVPDPKRNAAPEQPPQSSSVEAPRPSPYKKAGSPIKGETDKYGYYGHVDLHKTNERGEFVVGQSTGFLSLRPGNAKHPAKHGAHLSEVASSDGASGNRSGSDEAPQPLDEAGTGNATARAVEVDEEKCKLCARVMTSMFFNLNVTAFGKDFKPQAARQVNEDGSVFEVNEQQNMQDAMEIYCVQKGIQDIPAGIVLVSVVGAYYGCRFGVKEVRENTKHSLVGGLIHRVRCWAIDRKAAKAKRKSAESNSQGRAAESN